MAFTHIKRKILVLSLEGTERHQRGYSRVYLVGGFLLVGLNVGVGIRLHHHVTNRPDKQDRRDGALPYG